MGKIIKTIKGKFTLTLTVVLLGVIALFAVVIFFVNVNLDAPITPDVLKQVANSNPRLAFLLERINQDQSVSEVYQLVRQNQTEKYKSIFIILIPPTILLSALIAYLVSTYLIKPIEELTVNMKKIKSSNMSFRIPETKSSSEIELLTQSFNNLLGDLEKAFKIQDQFIQDAAHELRTPIAAMKTNIQVFNESNENSISDYKKLVTVVEKINNKLVNLNENLLLLNRKYIYNFETTNLYGIVDEVIDTLSIHSNKKNIIINNNIKDNSEVFIDPQKFSIAIKNLIENSIKYSNENSHINISNEETKDKQIIIIEDKGIGIKKEDLDRIFDRFYRAGNIKPNQEEGEGLGLSIVKKILKEHNADIQVESEVDKGTIFKVILNKKTA